MIKEQHMNRRSIFSVKLRRSATGEEHVRTVFAADESLAKERAIAKARAVLPMFVEMKYERFEVVSCDVDRSAAVSRKPTSRRLSKKHTVRYTELSPARFKDFWRS